jgi:hypothetical protein
MKQAEFDMLVDSARRQGFDVDVWSLFLRNPTVLLQAVNQTSGAEVLKVLWGGCFLVLSVLRNS